MKKKKGIPEDLAMRFWKEYDDLDYLEREKKLKFVVQRIEECVKMPDKLRKHALTMMMQSYFDDLLEYCNTKDRATNNRKANRKRVRKSYFGSTKGIAPFTREDKFKGQLEKRDRSHS